MAGSTAPRVIHLGGWSANGYLLESAEGIVAVDVGAPRLAREMAALVRDELRRPLRDLVWATATHYHVDHIGGLRELWRLTGCRIALPERARPYALQGGRMPFPKVIRYWHWIPQQRLSCSPNPRLRDILEMPLNGMPVFNRAAVFPVSAWLADGDEMPAAPGWRVLHLPGHSVDSVGYWHEASGSLLSGDSVLGNRRSAPLANGYVWDRQVMLTSLAQLARLPVRRLYPGHGPLHEGENLLAGIDRRLPEDPKLF